MSGRSAYVRKEKTKVKESVATDTSSAKTKTSASASTYEPNLSDFPIPGENGYGAPARKRPTESVVSGGSSGDKRLDESAYARVRKPPMPIIDVSGIEKSSFRALMDKRSEGFRKGLSGFGKKKKVVDEPVRPETASAMHPTISHELDAGTDFDPQPLRSRSRGGSGASRLPPPSGQLPPLPPTPQIKRFMGSGRLAQPWNKLRKDPELWDPHGDTLIFLAHETHEAARPPASFRVSSHVLERTDSRFFATILREGCTEFNNSSDDITSPTSSQGMRSGMSSRMGMERMGFPNPPSISEDDFQDPNGQISYELYFPAPINQSKVDSLRFHVTTRNVFALLYRASLVGLNMFQALEDLLERMQQYMPPQTDNAGLIIDYVTSKGIDDARNDPSTAVSLLLWSELRAVRWQEGWREFFVHCAGMHSRLDGIPELRLLSPITKALLERASLEGQVRIQNVEDRLIDFHFSDMWPAMSPTPPPEHASFERLRIFLKSYYETSCGSWPLPAPADSEQWLTRDLARRLQKDFGALYDYLVNRDVVWDCSEERSSRKWNIINANPDIPLTADTTNLPMTDILVAFDNRHRYPHIPHPYPLVPDSIPARNVSNEGLTKPKKGAKPAPTPEDRMAERRVALAYAEASNIYLLGPDFGHNGLVAAFTRFEKEDSPTTVDPHAARRGRWVLLYGILQALASISVDTPGIRYKEGVSYHLNPQLRGTPPWRKGGGAEADASATHEGSHCWTVPRSWVAPSEMDVPLLDSMSVSTSPMMSPLRRLALLQNGGGSTGSVRSSAAPSIIGTESDAGSVRGGSRRRRDTGSDKNFNTRRGIRSAGGEADRLTLGSAVGGNGSFVGPGGVSNFSPSSGYSGIVREHSVVREQNERPREREYSERMRERDHSAVREHTERTRDKELPQIGEGNYGPGIQKVEGISPWPIRESSNEDLGSERGRRERLIIKDFDDYNF